MQSLRIPALPTRFRAGRDVRARVLSSAMILLAMTGACSNAAPAAKHSTDPNESLASDAGASKLVVGYLPSWRGTLAYWTKTLEFSGFTHINLAFATIETENDELAIHYREDGAPSGDEAGLADFVKKAHKEGVKVCLAVGGGGERSITSGNAILKAHQELAKKLAAYAEDNQLDCIDVDQEEQYPTPELDAAYGKFIGELRTELHGKPISAAVASWNAEKILPVIDEFDFLNVMAYDFNRPGDSLMPVQASSLTDAHEELDWFESRGAKRAKLVLGVPFYGFKWSGNTGGTAIAYSQIVDQFGSAPTNDQIEVGTSTITLNSSPTIRSKAEFARENYAGIMIWELGQDASKGNSLLSVVKDVMR